MGPENIHGGDVDKDNGRRQGVCTHDMHIHLDTVSNLQMYIPLQSKSEDYYSVSPGNTFSSGRFQIRTLSLKNQVDYEVRVLEVVQVRNVVPDQAYQMQSCMLMIRIPTYICALIMQASNPSQTRTLDHYLFTGWPDYGVPKYPTSLIRMLYHVRDARVSDVPLLVHCR